MKYDEFVTAVRHKRQDARITLRQLCVMIGLGASQSSTLCRFEQGKDVSGQVVHALREWLGPNIQEPQQRKPYCCPACYGGGQVYAGQGPGTTSLTVACHACGGTGIVWG